MAVESVDVSQKGDQITLTLETDGSELIAKHEAQIESIEVQRASGLADRSSGIIDGVETKTPLTKSQKDSVNETHDQMITNANREYKLRILDLCIEKIRKAINVAAFDDADVEAERIERKAKVDAEINARVANKPTFDADAITAVAVKSR
jgi:hypothetical protein